VTASSTPPPRAGSAPRPPAPGTAARDTSEGCNTPAGSSLPALALLVIGAVYEAFSLSNLVPLLVQLDAPGPTAPTTIPRPRAGPSPPAQTA
jgi:hypothetical protein